MMKKVNVCTALMATLALGFTACTESEELLKTEQKELRLSVFANKSVRAPETSLTLNSIGKTFGVWGYSSYNGTATTVFNNQSVEYNGTDWEYSPAKYWDVLSSYKFYAYFPYQANGVTITDGKISVKDFTVDAVVADQVDLMIANEITRNPNTTIETVDFNFNHLLSNINLAFKKGTKIGTTKLTLNSVKLYGMDNKGSFTQTATTAATGNWALSGTNVITPSGATQLAPNDVVVPELTSNPAVATFANMLLIPQNTDNLKLDIEYTLGEGEHAQPFTRTLDLSYDITDRAYNLEAWGQNQMITYNFTIDANIIVFGEPDVTDWTPKQVDNIPTIE